MRELTDHIVNGDRAVQLKIEVTDEPGAGGANHRYEISGFNITSNPSAPGDVLYSSPTTEHIIFQNGPIKESGVNGVTQEALATIIIDRLRSFQAGPFSSEYNAQALAHFEEGLRWLKKRTVDRIARNVEGTHEK